MTMNFHRFLSLPTALKPSILILTLLVMILASSAPIKESSSLDGSWFFWLNILAQFIFMCLICSLFLYDAEEFLTLGRKDSWPVFEMSYSVVAFFCNANNASSLGHWQKYSSGRSNTYVIAELMSLLLVLLYVIGGIMSYRIWRGFVKSGAGQNPTANVQPGDIGNMHPGV